MAAMLAAVSITAQNVVDDIAARHPELRMLEIAATRPDTGECRTIAATTVKAVGRKCDGDELALMKSDKVAVDKEKEGFDATVPLHDGSRAVIAIANMTFRAVQGQSRATIIRQAQHIAAELEKRLTTPRKFFEPAR